MRLYPSRTPVAALWARLAAARRLPLTHELDDGRGRNAETGGCRPPAHPFLLNGPDDAIAQVQRKRLGHGGWPPAPALSVNHDLPTLGNPLSDSVRAESALAMIVRVFFFEPFNIPSGSMKSTLLVGDYLFVSKLSYGYSRYTFAWGIIPFEGRIFASEPKRGDVVVFKLPRDTSTDYIK